MVYARALGARGATHGGSSPLSPTKDTKTCPAAGFVLLWEAQQCCFSNCELGSRALSFLRKLGAKKLVTRDHKSFYNYM